MSVERSPRPESPTGQALRVELDRVGRLLEYQESFVNALMAHVPAIVLVTDRGGRVLRYNAFTASRTGFGREDMEDRHWLEVFVPAPERDELAQAMEELVAGRKTDRCAEGHLLTRHGRELSVRWTLSLLQTPCGEVSGVLVVGEDVTEIQQQNERIVHSDRMAAIGRLATSIAHEFNNQLTVIDGHCRLLERQSSLTESAHASLIAIRSSVERTARLTGQLLAFDRHRPHHPVLLNMNHALAGMVELLVRLVGEDVRVVVNPGSNLAEIWADPARFEQVVMNLVANARDAMPSGGCITIETANVQMPDQFTRAESGERIQSHVMLSVTNATAETREAVLGRLPKPSSVLRADDEAVGAGLATVHKFVQECGGNLCVCSEPDLGCTFALYLPRGELAAPDDQADAAAGATPGGGGTVLVVEDDDLLRQFVVGVLVNAGYRVLDAPNGRKALSLAGEHTGSIGLVIMDVVLNAEMGLSELAERLDEYRLGARTLYMSGYPKEIAFAHGLKSGDDFLAKPFSPDELLCRVRKYFDNTSEKESTKRGRS